MPWADVAECGPMIISGQQTAPRIVLYLRDTNGLGQLKRALVLSRGLAAHWPGLSQLIVTGAPLPQLFAFPEGVDYVKLPSVERRGPEQWTSRALPLETEQLRDLRSDMLLTLAKHYQPDVFMVDTFPEGLGGEVLPALRHLRDTSPRTRLALGLRDIVDEGAWVRQTWARDGIYELLEDLYELILVYGRSDIFDVVAEYGLPARAAAKTRHVGYLCAAPGGLEPAEVRAGLGLQTGRLVLVTAGGGRDGAPLFHAMLDALRTQRAAPFDCMMVGGPLMRAEDRQLLVERAEGLPPVRFMTYLEDLAEYIPAADVVVSMGGYNTVCEILAAKRPAVIVPRVGLSREQLVRAELFQQRDLIRMIHPAELTPDRLLSEIEQLLDRGERPGGAIPLDGLSGIVAELESVLAGLPA